MHHLLALDSKMLSESSHYPLPPLLEGCGGLDRGEESKFVSWLLTSLKWNCSSHCFLLTFVWLSKCLYCCPILALQCCCLVDDVAL